MSKIIYDEPYWRYGRNRYSFHLFIKPFRNRTHTVYSIINISSEKGKHWKQQQIKGQLRVGEDYKWVSLCYLHKKRIDIIGVDYHRLSSQDCKRICKHCLNRLNEIVEMHQDLMNLTTMSRYLSKK